MLSQREVVSFLIGEYFVDADEVEPRIPVGNQVEDFAPQGCYPCVGAERWIALSVAGDDQWDALREVLDLGDASGDQRFDTAEGRHGNAADLDAVITAATKEWDRDELVACLVERGIAASAVLYADEILKDPQLQALDFFQEVASASFPMHRQRGFCARFETTPGRVRYAAPRLGEHSRQILRELLNIDDAEVDRLTACGALFEDK
jgi:crotonobetainyl-CoA:carnitine CoA-transferase CaiB-like acyl-CoA transferase